MSEIRTIYHGHEPNWPATDQHPDAKRYYVYADGRVVEKPAEAQRGEEIPASANTALPEEERQRLAAEEGLRARAEKDRRAAEGEKEKPVYVVDAIGEPTLEEIQKVLDGTQQAPVPQGE